MCWISYLGAHHVHVASQDWLDVTDPFWAYIDGLYKFDLMNLFFFRLKLTTIYHLMFYGVEG